MITNSSIFKDLFDEFHLFLIYFICIVHDNGHEGRNNDYYIKSKHDLAYNSYNESVLENYHIVNTLKLLNDPETNIFSNQSTEKFNKTKKTIISSILATDNA